MLSRKEQFYKILRDNGISYYYCTKGFDPDVQVQDAKVMIPSDVKDIDTKILDLYNDLENNEDVLTTVSSKGRYLNTETYDFIVSRMQKRNVPSL